MTTLQLSTPASDDDCKVQSTIPVEVYMELFRDLCWQRGSQRVIINHLLIKFHRALKAANIQPHDPNNEPNIIAVLDGITFDLSGVQPTGDLSGQPVDVCD